MILKEKPNIFPNEFDFSLSKFLKLNEAIYSHMNFSKFNKIQMLQFQIQ